MNIEIQATQQVSSIDNPLQKDQATNPVPNNKNNTEVNKPQSVQKSAGEATGDNSKVTEIPRKTIEAAVNKIREYADQYKRDIRFSIDDDSGQTIVKLLDSNDKVLRQIPSEEVLNLAKSLKEQKGLLFKDQV
ncbi:MAG: flagellar protein FlaG [Gammaproteobacteria bacterium]|nr:flagellar protein FlaG [Gammaproteobacteria bacterium]